MIDVQNQVFTKLKLHLESKFEEISVKKGYQSESKKFPIVTFRESVNTTDSDTVDTSGEYCSFVNFEINIFTTGNYRESKCIKIRNEVDNLMNDILGMNRIFSQDVENFMDSTIFRYVVRYSCKIDKSDTIYRG